MCKTATINRVFMMLRYVALKCCSGEALQYFHISPLRCRYSNKRRNFSAENRELLSCIVILFLHRMISDCGGLALLCLTFNWSNDDLNNESKDLKRLIFSCWFVRSIAHKLLISCFISIDRRGSLPLLLCHIVDQPEYLNILFPFLFLFSPV